MLFRVKVAIFAGLIIALLTITVSILDHFNQPKPWVKNGSQMSLSEGSLERGAQGLRVVDLKPAENETLPPLDWQTENPSATEYLSAEKDGTTDKKESQSLTKKPKPKTSHSPVKFPIKINKATKAELMALPGIGEVLADRIIQKRNELGGFKKPEDLLLVKGIGEKKLEKIRGLIVLE